MRPHISEKRLIVPVVMAIVLLGFTPVRSWAAQPTGTASAGGGYVLMIHSTFEPHSNQVVDEAESGNVQFDQVKTGITYASGAAGATRDAEYIVFHSIPYLASTVYPVVVRNPLLEVTQVGGAARMMLQPNLPAGPARICHVETSWAGHEGPVDACSVYRVPVHDFDGINLVTLALHFEDASGPQRIIHSFPVHFLLHMAIEDAPIDLTTVAETITEPTPLIVQSMADMQSTSTS